MQAWLAEVDEQVFAAEEADIDTVGETMIRAVLGDEGWEAWPAEVQDIFTANGPAIAAEHRGGLLDVTPDELRSIAHPTLIVGGRESGPAFAEVTNLMAASMPNAEVEWVESGHVIDAAHPVVLGFVDRVLARPLL
jgi:pimeloyl-ACP methyl ester carboxylesterase